MNDYLIHYGIKGQQWGIRRYQNEDGSLTEEGKRRYGNANSLYSLDSKLNRDSKDDYKRIDSMYKEQKSAIKAAKKEAKLSGDKATIKAARKTARESMKELRNDRQEAWEEIADVKNNILARSVSRGKVIGEAALAGIGGLAIDAAISNLNLGPAARSVGYTLSGFLGGVAAYDVMKEIELSEKGYRY